MSDKHYCITAYNRTLQQVTHLTLPVNSSVESIIDQTKKLMPDIFKAPAQYVDIRIAEIQQ